MRIEFVSHVLPIDDTALLPTGAILRDLTIEVLYLRYIQKFSIFYFVFRGSPGEIQPHNFSKIELTFGTLNSGTSTGGIKAFT